MTRPRHYILLMVAYLAVVAVVCAALFDPLREAFMANWGFNLLIMGALAAGIGINFHQVLRLEPEIKWMQMFRTGQMGTSMSEGGTVLLKPLRKHLSGVHRDRFKMSALSLRTVLESIRAHLDESREISRYMIGLLIFLGLLGTFWGLLGTISSVGKIIGGLDVGGRDFAAVFASLKTGLQAPLAGMGTAFSSSLFGLGGSLVLGFLDIQANHAQNRFFNEMEEWLSGVTQLIDQDEAVEGAGGPVSISGLERTLETLIEEMRRNQQTLEKLAENRRPTDGEPEG